MKVLEGFALPNVTSGFLLRPPHCQPISLSSWLQKKMRGKWSPSTNWARPPRRQPISLSSWWRWRRIDKRRYQYGTEVGFEGQKWYFRNFIKLSRDTMLRWQMELLHLGFGPKHMFGKNETAGFILTYFFTFPLCSQTGPKFSYKIPLSEPKILPKPKPQLNSENPNFCPNSAKCRNSKLVGPEFCKSSP